jgi:hypothetical protein
MGTNGQTNKQTQAQTNIYSIFRDKLSLHGSLYRMHEGVDINQVSWTGWEEAHHLWSKSKHQYTASELLKHLCKVVIPLQDVKEVPIEAPIKLPTRPDSYTLGTKSADLLGLDDAVLAKEERIRLKAMLEQDRRENSGFGNQLMGMQQKSWAIDKIHRGSFKIDMCYNYGDDDGNVLQWCQGTVVKVLKEEKNYVTVEIKWDKECLREGGRQ